MLKPKRLHLIISTFLMTLISCIFWISFIRAGTLEFEGVPVDITTASNEDLVIAPGEGGNTQIGDKSGTNTNAATNDDLYVTGVIESNGAIYADAGITSGGNILADTDSTRSLGSTSNAWLNLYVDTISGYNANLAFNPASGYGLTSAVTRSAATGNEIAYDLTATINKATSGNYTGLKLNVTETSAPGTADRLLDLLVGGTSRLFVSSGDNSANYGMLSVGKGAWDGSTSGYFAGNSNGTVIAANTEPTFTGNLVDLQVAGSPKLSVDALGNVTAAGTIAGSGTLGGSGTVNYLPKWTAATTLGNSLIYDNGTNVGIGTTNPTGGKLHVRDETGWAQISIDSPTNNAVTLLSFREGSTLHTDFVQLNSQFGSEPEPSNSFQIRARTVNGDIRLFNLISGDSRNGLIISPTNKVGIGTTSPVYLLDILGGGAIPAQIRLSDVATDATTKNAKILARHYINSEEDFVGIQIVSNDTDNIVRLGGSSGAFNSATMLSFYTAANNTTLIGTERVRIDTSGNVGIGTTSPASNSLTLGALGTADGTNQGYNSRLLTLRGSGWTGAAAEDIDIGMQNIVGSSANYGLIVDKAPAATVQKGLFSLGSGGFTGAADNFSGSASGTLLAGNTASGFAGNLVDLQVTGSSKFSVDASGNVTAAGTIAGSGTLGGSGTVNYLPKWTAATTLGNSLIYDNGTNVGIGTTSPAAKLHVYGTTLSQPMIIFEDVTADTNPSIQIKNDAQAWNLQTVGARSDNFEIFNATAGGAAANAYLTVTTDGNVGIGTTGPDRKLYVMNDAAQDASNSILCLNSSAVGSSNLVVIRATKSSGAGKTFVFGVNPELESNGGFTIGRATSATAYNSDFMVGSTGNVGIGTTNPYNLLRILGNDSEIEPIAGAATLLTQINVGNESSGLDTKAGISFTHKNSDGSRYTPTGIFSYRDNAGTTRTAKLGFFVTAGDNILDSEERMTINSSGNVGIGTTNPASNSLTLGALGTADGTNQGYNSRLLTLRGSGWTGAAAEDIDIGIQNIVGSSANYGLIVDKAPAATVQKGLFSLGSGGFTGAANNFSGSASGTLLAGNTASGFAGNLVDLQVAGASKFSVDASGNVTAAGNITQSGFTAGSVIFAGTGGTITQDNANLFWDDTNNRLGIGTTVPGEKLEVSGTIAATGNYSGAYAVAGLYLNNSGGNGQIASLGVGGTGRFLTIEGSNIAFNTVPSSAFTEAMRIIGNGNVGIGTTGPGAPLEIVKDQARTALTGAAKGVLHLNGGGALTDVTAITFDGYSSFPGPTSIIGQQITSNGSNLFFGTSANWQTVDNTAMYINYLGNVGIGTTEPGAKLQIGSLQTEGGITTTTKLLQVTGTNVAEDAVVVGGVYGRHGGFTIRTPSTDSKTEYRFGNFDGASGYTQMLLASNGNVGIGTTEPGYKLDIWRGDTSGGQVGLRLFSDYGVGGGSSGIITYNHLGFNLDILSDRSSAGTISLSTVTGGTAYPRMSITNSGNVGIGTTSPASNSLTLGALGTADGTNQGYNSRLLTLRGSGWTGAAAEDIDIGIQNIVGSSANYGLIVDKAPAATVQKGLFSLGSGGFTGAANNFSGSASGTLLAGNTASGFAGNLVDLQVAGASKFSVDASGNVTAAGNIIQSGFTPGSVLFAGSGGTITQDNANLFWDDTNNRLGIGTTVPTYNLHVVGSTGVYTNVTGVSAIVGNTTSASGAGYAVMGYYQGSGTTGTGVYAYSLGATTNRGIYIEAGGPGAGANNWALYSASQAQSYFAGNVGIGTAGPSLGKLQIEADQATASAYIFGIKDSSILGGTLTLGRALGTQAIKTAVNNNNVLGKLFFAGYDGTNFGGGAEIDGVAEGTFSGTSWPTRLTFSTTPASSVTSVERMRIDSTGNVGIGTTNPGYKLDVQAPNTTTQDFEGLRIFNTNPSGSAITTAGIILGITNSVGIAQSKIAVAEETVDGANTGLAFYTNIGTGVAPTEKVRIQSNGNVGIGTTSPSTALEVNGTVKATAFSTATSSIDGYSLDAADGSPTDALYVDNTGNVGIGTTEPGALLDVKGAMLWGTNSPGLLTQNGGVGYAMIQAQAGWHLFFSANARATPDMLINYSSGNVEIAQNLVVSGTGNSSIAGNVGIGTTTPSTLLHISSGTAATNAVLMIENGYAGSSYVPSFLLKKSNNAADTKIYDAIVDGSGIFSFRAVNDAMDVATNWMQVGRTGTTINYVSLVPTSGNVGIGTTNPTAKLQVYGSGTQQIRITADNDNQYQTIIENNWSAPNPFNLKVLGATILVSETSAQNNFLNASNNVGLRIGNATKLLIDSSGNVGIGTTNPSYALDVQGGTGPIARVTGTTGNPLVSAYTTNNGVNVKIQALDGGSVAYVGTESNHNLALIANNVPKVTIQNDGNVGIGTTNPTHLVDIQSTASTPNLYIASTVTPDGTAVGGRIDLSLIGGTSKYVLAGDTVGNLAFGAQANDNTYLASGIQSIVTTGGNTVRGSHVAKLIFLTKNNDADGAVERMVILGNGNVGIGTTSPSTALEVNGTVKATAFSTVTSSIDGYSLDAADGSPTDALYVDNTGNVGIGTTNPSQKLEVNGYGVFSTGLLGTDANNYLYLYPSHASNKYLVLDDAKGFSFMNGNVGIGTTGPTGLLHIHAAAGSDPTIRLTDGDVSHGITAYAMTTDTVWRVQNINETAGGAIFSGLSDSAGTNGMVLFGVIGVTDPTDTVPAILINGSKKLTTGEQAMGASETVLQVETGSLTSGTKLLTVLGSGNVGIGTTELVAKLDIKDTNQIVDSFGNLYIHTSDAQAIDKGGMIGFGGDGGGGVGYGTTFATISGRKENGASGHYEGYLQFGTSNSGATGSEKMRITSTGNVGIGTTNPLAKLDVGGGGAQTSAGVAVRSLAGGTSNSFEWGHANAAGYGSTIGYEYSSGAPYIAFQAEAGTNINTYKTRGFAGFVIKKDLNIPGLTFSTVATASADNQALTTLMTIKNDGNVGIGTTNPSTALEVNGTVKATAFSTVTSSIDGYSLDAADGSPTDALYVDNDGNVGIGTTNPSDKLQVVGAIRPGAGSFTAGVGKVYLSSSNGYGMVMTGNTDTISDLGLFAANGQILLMNPTGTNNTVLNPTSGNVGIGTTTPGTYFGVPSILDVSSASNHGFININGATGKISALGFSENGSQKWLIDSQNTYTTPNNRLSFLNSSATEVMTLTSGGNVGIGTTGPGTKLMVQDGAISIFHNNGSNGAGYSISGYTNGSGGAGAQQYIAGIFFLQQGAATQSGHIDFNTANGGVTTEKMRLWAAGGLSFGSTYVATDPGAGSMIIEGNVGIGTTEPGAKLEVAGVTKLTAAVQTDSAVLQISPDATGSGGIDIASTYNGAGGYGPLTFTLSGAEKMRITSSGHVGIGNTGPGNKLNVSASGAPTTNGALSGLFVTSYTDGSVADGIGIGDSGVAAYKWIQSYNGVLVLNPIDNNVGIGTTTPGSKLEVTGDVNYTAAGKEGQLRISGSTNNNYELMLGYDTTDNFGFITAAQYNTGWTNLALNPNGGNVGIGTTSPGTKLEVSSGGTIPVILTLSTRDGYNTTFENNYDAFNPFSIKSFTFPILTVESSAANTYLDSHDYGGTSGTGLRVGGSTVLFAKTGGNVGIGTTSPGGGTGSSVLTLANSSAAPTALANTTHLYSSAGEGYWMDAAGNATLQTPHDPVTGEWIFFSKNLKTGRVVKVDMEKLVREVERLSGKRFMMESFEQPHS